MHHRLRLYYFPSSYYSQKVLIALHEKDLKFEPHVIDIHTGHQYDPWYMRMNPAGTVPTLQDGEKIIKDSEEIISYIDRKYPKDSRLVPEHTTEEGKEVAKWRKLLNTIHIDLITTGTMCYPELSVSGLKFPRSLLKTKDEIISNLQISEKKLEQLSDLHFPLREGYHAKKAIVHKRLAVCHSKEKAVTYLDDLESILDQVEKHLKKVDAAPTKDVWFCGKQFTAVDITLCVLMGMLDILGLGERYHSLEIRPLLHAYWLEAQNRPSVHHVVGSMVRNLMFMALRQGIKKALPVFGGLVTVGLAAALTFLFVQKK